MACYSSQKQQQNNFVGPRISFSNGFAEAESDDTILIKQKQQQGTDNSTKMAADFEFCVAAATCAMNSSADELFFNGKLKLLPLSKECNYTNIDFHDYIFPEFNTNKVTTTLRDELLNVSDDDHFDASDDDRHCDGRMRFPRASSKGVSTSGYKLKERFDVFKLKPPLH